MTTYQISGQPAANAVVSAMEIIAAIVVMAGIAIAYEISQRKNRR